MTLISLKNWMHQTVIQTSETTTFMAGHPAKRFFTQVTVSRTHIFSPVLTSDRLRHFYLNHSHCHLWPAKNIFSIAIKPIIISLTAHKTYLLLKHSPCLSWTSPHFPAEQDESKQLEPLSHRAYETAPVVWWCWAGLSDTECSLDPSSRQIPWWEQRIFLLQQE